MVKKIKVVRCQSCRSWNPNNGHYKLLNLKMGFHDFCSYGKEG